MSASESLTMCIVIVAMGFDFVNGFHDAANSIATLVATKTLKPRQAVLWASFFNIAAVFIFGTGVAKTVGSGLVDLQAVTPPIILAGLVAAIGWGLLTWWRGLPSSSSHALLGGYAGAALMGSAMHHGWAGAGDVIVASGWIPTLVFIVAAPLLGLVLATLSMKLCLRFFPPSPRADRLFKHMQLVSSAFLSLMHGGNDAQKTAGIVAGALLAGGAYKEFTIPIWVLYMSYGMMGMGTLVGGWRIVDTLGNQLTRLRPEGGFCAESSAALSILLASLLHLPVSTTHVTTGAILGVGAARSPRAVRWGLAGNIAWAWILTLPATAVLGACLVYISVRMGFDG